jgi:predicted ester cyclase
MTRPEVDALLARHQESFASRDSARLAADHAEQGTFTSPAAGTVTGRARIREVYDYWLEAFPDMDFTWTTPIVEGTRAALFWRFRGTLSGKFFGEARAGTRIQFPGAAEYILAPEGIVTATHVFDFTGTLVNAGVLRVKPVD